MIGQRIFAAGHQPFAQAGAVAAGIGAVKAVTVSGAFFGRGRGLFRKELVWIGHGRFAGTFCGACAFCRGAS